MHALALQCFIHFWAYSTDVSNDKEPEMHIRLGTLVLNVNS